MEIFFTKLFKLFYCPMPRFYNVQARHPYEFQKIEQLVEIPVIAYSGEEALVIAQDIVKKFNQKEEAKFCVEKAWRVKTLPVTFTQNDKDYSLRGMVQKSDNFKPTTEELTSWINSSAVKTLHRGYNEVQLHDFPATVYKKQPSIC